MSPKEQKMTSGREAMAWARSIISSEVTQTADATTAYRERSGVDIARADSTAPDGTLANFSRDNTLIARVSDRRFQLADAVQNLSSPQRWVVMSL